MTRRSRVLAAAPVLFVHHGLDWITGSERCLLDLMARIDRSRYSPVLLCDADALSAAAAAMDVPVHRSAGWHAEDSGLCPRPAAVRQARDIVRRHGIRVIHANDEDPIKSLVPVARAERIPLLAHLHIISNADERRWSLLHQVSMAVGVSRAAIQGLIDDGVPAHRLRVIYNGVDTVRLERGDARGLRAELGIGEREVTVAVVGSLIDRKGVDVVLAAFAALRASRSDCHLIVIGDGPERTTLERETAALGVGSSVHFLGRRDDVGAILRDATDIVVSAAKQEAFPLNLLEAAYFEIPVVASDIEPHKESVCAGETGMLVPGGDAAAFARALHLLAGDPQLGRRFGAAARRRVLDRFLVDRYVSEFEALYADLLSRPPRQFGWLGGTRWPPAYRKWVTAALRRRIRRLHNRAPTPGTTSAPQPPRSH